MKINDMTATLKDYQQFLESELSYMDESARNTVSSRFVKDVQRNKDIQSVFDCYIETYANVTPEAARQTVQVNLSKDVADIAGKLNERLNDYVPPKIETNPLKRISNAQSRIASLVKKCSATIRHNGAEIDVSDFCRSKALEGLNVQSIKPEDKIKDKYNYSSEGSFNGKKLTLELVVSR